MGRLWRRLSREVSRRWLRRRLAASPVRLELLGQGHAAWWAPATWDGPQIAYCCGVGMDATYDFALAARAGYEVHSFDPTPGSIAFMERENQGRVHFHPWGVMGEDRVVRFHAPMDPRHANWFAENLHGTDAYFEAECFRIGTIMRKLGHTRLDILKLDVEGSWHSTMLGALADGVRPRLVCIEFDSPAPLARVREVTLGLEAAGYRAVAAIGDNVAFLREG